MILNYIKNKKFFIRSTIFAVTLLIIFAGLGELQIGINKIKKAEASYRFEDFSAGSPIHIFGLKTATPKGLSPSQIKKIYNLPSTGGSGTIAIIGAYDAPNIEHDLNIFSKKYGLPPCTSKSIGKSFFVDKADSNKPCFEKHIISSASAVNVSKSTFKVDEKWALETSLDVEWAHAIAPKAKILLVEAQTQSGANLMKAIDYARSQSGVVAVSMSWGGPEFSNETDLDSHFVSLNGHDITFIASSGDSGYGTSWPAVSPNVIAVGGTSLNFSSLGKFMSEKAWAGSGGGISSYENLPQYQKDYSIKIQGITLGMRAIPDVSYNADPRSGFSVFKTDNDGTSAWYVIGGTSAGAPQWAGIKALGLSLSSTKIYNDKSSADNKKYFRDIVSGTNGDCGPMCNARKRYDFVTGLGSPLTHAF